MREKAFLHHFGKLPVQIQLLFTNRSFFASVIFHFSCYIYSKHSLIIQNHVNPKQILFFVSLQQSNPSPWNTPSKSKNIFVTCINKWNWFSSKDVVSDITAIWINFLVNFLVSPREYQIYWNSSNSEKLHKNTIKYRIYMRTPKKQSKTSKDYQPN